MMLLYFLWAALLLNVFLVRGLHKPCINRVCSRSNSMKMTAAGFDSNNVNFIKPSQGTKTNDAIEKFLMMYTCKICSSRNAQMISKVAYYKGMVVSTCRSCKNYHLIADNERKLDMGGDYGPRIDEFLASKGETVQKLTMSLKELEENYLVDKDGVLSIIPKSSGQPPPSDSTIIEYPTGS